MQKLQPALRAYLQKAARGRLHRYQARLRGYRRQPQPDQAHGDHRQGRRRQGTQEKEEKAGHPLSLSWHDGSRFMRAAREILRYSGSRLSRDYEGILRLRLLPATRTRSSRPAFVVVSRQVKPKKSGEPYLALTLGDRSGQLEAKMWDNVEDAIDAFDQDDFIKVKGLINKYKNRFQLTIHKLRRMGESEVDFADYLPKTTKDIGELWQTLAGLCRHLPESASQGAGRSVHGRPGDRGGLSQRSRRQDAASRLHRRPARSRRLAVAVPAI